MIIYICNIVDVVNSLVNWFKDLFNMIKLVVTNIFQGIVFFVQLLDKALSYPVDIYERVPVLIPFVLLFEIGLIVSCFRSVK